MADELKKQLMNELLNELEARYAPELKFLVPGSKQKPGQLPGTTEWDETQVPAWEEFLDRFRPWKKKCE